MKIKFTQRAPEGAVFGPGVFDAQIGHAVDLTMGGTVYQDVATLTEATVSEDGHKVTLAFEIPQGEIADTDLVSLIHGDHLSIRVSTDTMNRDG